MWKQSDVRCAGQGLYMELSITSVAIITAAKSKPHTAGAQQPRKLGLERRRSEEASLLTVSSGETIPGRQCHRLLWVGKGRW